MNGWTGFEITSGPAVEPVTADAVKTELRLTTSTHDTMIGNKIRAARVAVEKYLRKQLITATYRAYWRDFENRMEFPYGPVQSVSSITYEDTAGDSQTLASTVYRTDLRALDPFIELEYSQSWPTSRNLSNAITVTYVAGYGDSADDVPQIIRIAIIAMAVDMYIHPEMSTEIVLHDNRTVRTFLNSVKRTSFV